MRYSGFYAQAHRGATYHMIMVIGEHPSAFFSLRDKSIWEDLLPQIIDKPNFEWIMIDGSHINIHPHAAGTVGGQSRYESYKRGLTPRYTCVDAYGMPIRFILTKGARADCTQASILI